MSPVKANEIGTGGNVVVVVVVVDVVVLDVDVVVSATIEVGVVTPGTFGSTASVETVP
jgi:hypothetical protein